MKLYTHTFAIAGDFGLPKSNILGDLGLYVDSTLCYNVPKI